MKVLPKSILSEFTAKQFDVLSRDAISGLKGKAVKRFDPSVFEVLDEEQMGAFKSKTLKKLDKDQISEIAADAFGGLLPDQGAKMNKVIASNFDRDQIQSIKPECLNAMPGSVFSLLEPDLSNQQLTQLAALQSQGEALGGEAVIV